MLCLLGCVFSSVVAWCVSPVGHMSTAEVAIWWKVHGNLWFPHLRQGLSSVWSSNPQRVTAFLSLGCVCVCGGEWVMLRVPICPQDKHRGISFAYFHLVSIQACAHRCNFIYIARGNASTATGKLCNNGKLWISLQASLFEWPEPLWGMCTPSLPESSWKLKQFLQGHQTWEVERFWAGFSSSVPSTVPSLPFACLSLDLHLVNH